MRIFQNKVFNVLLTINIQAKVFLSERHIVFCQYLFFLKKYDVDEHVVKKYSTLSASGYGKCATPLQKSTK